jgi:hypothetical protein
VRRGDFIEDTFGGHVKRDVLANGVSAHRRYGTWLLRDPGQGVLGAEPMVGHLDARGCWAKWVKEEDEPQPTRRNQTSKLERQAVKKASQQKSREKAAMREAAQQGEVGCADKLKARGGYYSQLSQLSLQGGASGGSVPAPRRRREKS